MPLICAHCTWPLNRWKRPSNSPTATSIPLAVSSSTPMVLRWVEPLFTTMPANTTCTCSSTNIGKSGFEALVAVTLASKDNWRAALPLLDRFGKLTGLKGESDPTYITRLDNENSTFCHKMNHFALSMPNIDKLKQSQLQKVLTEETNMG